MTAQRPAHPGMILLAAALLLLAPCVCRAPGAPASRTASTGPATPRVATRPATRPAAFAGPAPAFRDEWLSRIILDELERAGAKGEFAALEETVRSAALARLAAGHLDRLAALNDLCYVRRACEVLPIAQGQPDGNALVKVLLADRDLARLLYRAIEESGDARAAIQNLQALWKAAPQAVQQYPNLAVAFATAHPPRSREPNAATIEESFRFYTDKGTPFRNDLKALPYELARYLADTRLPPGERLWARKTYGNQGELASTYFDLQYDDDYYKDGKPKKIASLPYTLPNLRKVGGVCIDQAYYAAQVCKALGVPATIVTGEGASGTGHAWVACFKLAPGGQRGAWDLNTGRYAAHKYYTGEVREPATGKTILDTDLALVGAAALLPLARREEADAACELAQLVDRLQLDAPPEANRAALRFLAEAYNARFAKPPTAPAVDLDRDLPPARKLDASLAEDLLALSLDRNLAHRPAWELLIAMRTAGRLPVEHLDRFFEVLVARTAGEYPDFSCNMILRIVPTLPDPEQRLKVYQKILAAYPKRPDLQGRILLAVGDEFHQQKKNDKALAAYQQAANQCVDLAVVVMKAAERAETLFAETRRPDLAIDFYAKLFAATRKPRDSAFRSSTAWHKLGKRLADLLAGAGKDAEARNITRMVEG